MTITAENFNDKSHTWTCDFVSAANTSCVAMEISEADMNGYTDKTSVLLCSLKSDLCNHHTRYYLSKPANVVYPEAEIMILEKDWEKITLLASDYAPVVRLEGNCIFEDNYFSMIKGEIRTIGFKLFEGESVEKIEVATWIRDENERV